MDPGQVAGGVVLTRGGVYMRGASMRDFGLNQCCVFRCDPMLAMVRDPCEKPGDGSENSRLAAIPDKDYRYLIFW